MAITADRRHTFESQLTFVSVSQMCFIRSDQLIIALEEQSKRKALKTVFLANEWSNNKFESLFRNFIFSQSLHQSKSFSYRLLLLLYILDLMTEKESKLLLSFMSFEFISFWYTESVEKSFPGFKSQMRIPLLKVWQNIALIVSNREWEELFGVMSWGVFEGIVSPQ